VSVTVEPTTPAPAPTAPSPLGVGVVVWLASELMFFAGLFAAYFTLRSVNDTWPPDGAELPVARTALATVVLVASSGVMHLAVVAAKRGDSRTAARWLGVTALMGAVFLSNQVFEYAEAPFQIDDHAYGSIFYLMTGFHGLHVLGGLIFIGAVAAVIAGRSRAPTYTTVEVCAYYWHFVDVVWVAMFATVYILR
jgi:cytochrome c oxidase subunit 3